VFEDDKPVLQAADSVSVDCNLDLLHGLQSVKRFNGLFISPQQRLRSGNANS